MLRFRRVKTLQQFASVYASLDNHFNQERHLISREALNTRRPAALAERRQIESQRQLRVGDHTPKWRRVAVGLTAPANLNAMDDRPRDPDQLRRSHVAPTAPPGINPAGALTNAG
jgi:hypothetical protein